MKNFLTDVMREIKKDMVSQSDLPFFDRNISDFYFEENRFNNQPYLMPLCIMRTKPCYWIRVGGGCAVCGYNLNTSVNSTFTEENLINQAKYITKSLDPKIYPLITVASTGSFLDSNEIPDSTRRKILQIFKDSGYKFFNFECRPEFLVDEKKLAELNEFFPDAVSVGIGLESSNDFVRNYCMNKGYPTKTYLKAVEKLKKYNFIYDAYVLYGKPFLTEKENIEDAINTIKFAFENGSSWAILMVANMQPYTISHWLWKRGKYQIPNLWGIIDILEALPEYQRNRVIVKGFYRAMPEPLFYASTCEKCSRKVVEGLNDFDLTGDYLHIERIKNSCECKTEWKNELDKPVIPLKERIKEYYNYISMELFHKPYEEHGG